MTQRRGGSLPTDAAGLAETAFFVVRRIPEAVGWFLAVFTLINVFGGLLRSRFDASYTWMPWLAEAGWGGTILLCAMSVLILWSLLRSKAGVARYALTQAVLVLLALAAIADGVLFYRALWEGAAFVAWPFPFAGLSFAALLCQMWRVRAGRTKKPERTRLNLIQRVAATFLSVGLVVGVFLAGQFFLVGGVEPNVKADCIIVMGAGVMPDGDPSISLYDRTRTACLLYNEGRAGAIIFSGGPSEYGVSEPEVMAGIAERLAVPARACVLDERGLNSAATVRNAKAIMARSGWRTAIVVSHDYHLSRIGLAFRRADVEANTWPAERSRWTFNDFYVTGRECAAWWYYYVRLFWQPRLYDSASARR